MAPVHDVQWAFACVLPCKAPQMMVQMQGNHADAILGQVLSEAQQGSIDASLAKQITLAVLRHAIHNPKVYRQHLLDKGSKLAL